MRRIAIALMFAATTALAQTEVKVIVAPADAPEGSAFLVPYGLTNGYINGSPVAVTGSTFYATVAGPSAFVTLHTSYTQSVASTVKTYIRFTNEIYDSHNIWQNGTGVVPVVYAGCDWLVSVTLMASLWATDSVFDLGINTNGVLYTSSFVRHTDNGLTAILQNTCVLNNLAAGTQISVSCYTTSITAGAVWEPNVANNKPLCYVSIKCLGRSAQ